MMCTGTEDTDSKTRHGGPFAMAGMMENCGCADMMAMTMAACIGSAADRAGPADGAEPDDHKD